MTAPRSCRPARAGRLWLAIGCALLLAGCAADPNRATDTAVAAARYRDDAPPSLTLYTANRVRGGEGAHSGLMINTPEERILFDPAGNFAHASVPEQGDVLYGMTPQALEAYIDFHARPTYYVTQQTVIVSPEVARIAAARAKAHGPTPKTFCSSAVSDVLSGVPGFESVSSFFPGKLSREFGALGGVSTTYFQDDDWESGNGIRQSPVPTPRDPPQPRT